MEHLAIAETYPPEDRPLDVRSVAAVLRISPTTLYKYGLNRRINAAEQRQRETSFIAGAAIEQDYFKGEIRKLSEEIEKERERSKTLVGRIAIMEANAARLGFDPEEMQSRFSSRSERCRGLVRESLHVKARGEVLQWRVRTSPVEWTYSYLKDIAGSTRAARFAGT